MSIQQHHSILIDESRKNRQLLALQVFMKIGIFVLFPAAAIDYILFSKRTLGIFEMFLGILSIIFFLLVRHKTKLPIFVFHTFVFLTGLAIWLITLMLETDLSTLLWSGIFPFISFYLLGTKRGLILHVIFTLVMFVTLYYGWSIIPYNSNTQILINISGTLIAFGTFAYLHERSLDQSNKQLLQYSYLDELTGIGNRKLFTYMLHKSKAHAKRTGKPLSLILIDIDFFKHINDVYGHLAGDIVLTEFARILSNSIRKEDILVRWGGEEFAIIVHETNLDNAISLAEKLRKTVQEFPFSHAGNLTASFGVIQIQIETTDNENILRADQALYQAKADGRNRVVGA